MLRAFDGDWNVARHARGLSGATDAEPLQAGCEVVNVLNDDNPYPFHPGGVLAVMGDGAVTFMAESIDAPVFAALMSRDEGGAAGDPDGRPAFNLVEVGRRLRHWETVVGRPWSATILKIP